MGKFDSNALRYQYLKEYLATLHLNPDFIEYVANPNNNPSQHPYHNSQHCYTVAINCILASEYYKLSDKNLAELVIASIFHDWGHSGGTLTESENIEASVSAYNAAVSKFSLKLDHQTIIRLIRATQYPHMPVFEIQEQIIQDADLLQYLHEDVSEWVKASNHETGDKKSNLEVAEFISKQKFSTKWGEKEAEKTVKRLTGQS